MTVLYKKVDRTEDVGQSLLINRLKIIMNTNRLSWTNIKSAIVSGVVMGVLALIAFFLHAGTFFGVDYHAMINVFGLAALGAIGSIITSLLTTPSTGNFVGMINIK